MTTRVVSIEAGGKKVRGFSYIDQTMKTLIYQYHVSYTSFAMVANIASDSKLRAFIVSLLTVGFLDLISYEWHVFALLLSFLYPLRKRGPKQYHINLLTYADKMAYLLASVMSFGAEA